MAQQAPAPPIQDTPMDITTLAVVNNPDGSLFYKQGHTFTNCDTEVQTVIYSGLEKMQKFMDDQKEKQKKEPDAIFTATLSATGMPDLYYEAFTYKMFDEVRKAWDKLGDEWARYGEKRIKGKGKP